jgi:hypothetical protein
LRIIPGLLQCLHHKLSHVKQLGLCDAGVNSLQQDRIRVTAELQGGAQRWPNSKCWCGLRFKLYPTAIWSLYSPRTSLSESQAHLNCSVSCFGVLNSSFDARRLLLLIAMPVLL